MRSFIGCVGYYDGLYVATGEVGGVGGGGGGVDVVVLVNAVVPFVLNVWLKLLMLRSLGRDKHIVNVFVVEG